MAHGMKENGMKHILLLTLILLAPAGQLWAVTEAIFSSVSGKVVIKRQDGSILRAAEKDSAVVEGQRIVAGSDGRAILKTFDGSEIRISPNTDLVLKKLRKPQAKDKIIQFKLLMGQLLALVKPLLSSHSTFEIESGGVVCGVRGTRYQVKYEPSTHTVYLQVMEGTVYADSNGRKVDYGPGSSVVFHNGVPGKAPNNGVPNGKGADSTGASLQDLEDQFQIGLSSNGNRVYTDPSVEGSIKVKLSANVGLGENVP
jgi:hypothetical protein